MEIVKYIYTDIQNKQTIVTEYIYIYIEKIFLDSKIIFVKARSFCQQ